MEKQLLDKSVIESGEMVLNMGPQHPSTHGVLRLKIHTDGEVVSKIEPILGYLHRCFEKITYKYTPLNQYQHILQLFYG